MAVKVGKALSEMSLEELWQLFPIILTEHKDYWKEWYREEEERLRAVLPLDRICRMSHIGSTSIPHIWAKPTIDILIEVKRGGSYQAIKEIILQQGYTCMSEETNRISFNKGYTENGFAEKVYHLHLREKGDHDELYFRDYMIDHPHTAKEYEKLKLDLWKEYEHNREGYTNAKADFVTNYTEQGKRLYKGRYEQEK